jgi:type IV pilus assembly protein PilQ
MRVLLVLGLAIYSYACSALNLLNLETKSLIDNKTQVMLEFDGHPATPVSFALSAPAQLVFDFEGVENKLPKEKKQFNLSSPVIKKVTFAATHNKLRLIVDAVNNVAYNVEIYKNKMIITFDNDDAKLIKRVNEVTCVDFKRTDAGAGQLAFEFSDIAAIVNITEYENKIVAKIKGARASDPLLRNYDVRDFNTIVQNFNLSLVEDEVVITILVSESFDKISYQLDNKLILELSSLRALNKKNISGAKQGFTGEKISLNFQDVSVRKAIQVIADFTNLNIVANDSVIGNITLRLQDVPWDQALDFILKAKSLSMNESQGVYLIVPQAEATVSDQNALQKLQQQESMAPLVSDDIIINYAKAADLVKILKSSSSSLLSIRGQLSADERTNLLMIKDIADNVAQVRSLVKRLDVPVRQVLIESQLVLSSDDFTKGLGVKFGGGAIPSIGRKQVAVGTTARNARNFITSSSPLTDPIATLLDGQVDKNMFFDLGTAVANAGSVGFALGRLPGGTLLDLELQAGENENKTHVISKPKLITLDKVKASIAQGAEIPVNSNNGVNGNTTTFKLAVLKLEVTPQISPDDTVFMDLVISQDEPGKDGAINTMKMNTSVSVPDGETIVLGGIFKLSESNNESKIPLLSDIPVLGKIFKNSYKSINRNELLIFITPKIIRKS